MADVEARSHEFDPAVDRTGRPANVFLVVLLSLSLVGASVALAVMQRDQAEPYVLALLGVLAAIGVVSLFAAAIGLVRIGGRTERDPLARDFLDTMMEGVLITDPSNRIMYANRAYADLTGSDRSGIVRGIERVFSADPDAAEAVFRLTQAARDGRRAIEEVRIAQPLAADTSGARWYRIRVRPIESLQNAADIKSPLVVWQVADITRDRDEQENSFQELQRAINFLDHAPAGFFSADPSGRLLYMNATLADWLGHDLAQFEAGQVMLTDIIRGDGAALVDASKINPGEAKTEIVDIDLVKRSGQSLPVRLLHRVPFAADGTRGDSRTLVLNRSPGEDVSEALRAAEVRFARFFNNTPIAIASISSNGSIQNTNAPFARLLRQANKPDGGQLINLIEEQDRDKVTKTLKEAQRGQGDVAPVDVSLIGEGEDRALRFYFSSVSDTATEDADALVILYALETTEQRALEAQFAQSQKMQAIGQLAGGVAHDFNNLLTAIIGFSDLLLSNHRPTDPAFQDIMNIKQNANRAAGLVRQLLAFSRRQTMRPQRLELNNMIADLSILLDRLLGERVELKVQHGRDLWPVMADLNQLEQVIINLAVNARDAMPDGGMLTIRTRNATVADRKPFAAEGLVDADYILIEVEDTGTGIPPEIMQKIFEPFFSTKEVGKGTGLGLSTVYGIVKQTDGFIYCRSEMGKGTTFSIFLPRFIPAQKEEKKAPVQLVALADLTGSASILLVEDEDAVRAFSARALTSRGYTVHEASTGTEALEVMEETGGSIDLVVSDVVMPEMDGPTLLKELRRKRPDLKIIFVSGYAEEAFRKNLPENEKFNFLPKPFSLKQLATTVKETLAE